MQSWRDAEPRALYNRRAMTTPLFERLLALCGKRCDDPALIAFHAEEGLEPPPTTLGCYVPAKVRHSGHGYELHYIAALKRPETWPPKLGPKGFLTYLQRVRLREAFAPHLPAPFELELDPARAQALAIRSGPSRETHIHTVYRLYEQGERSLEVRFGPLSATKPMYTALTIDELDADDPRLEKISRDELGALDRRAERFAAPPPKSARKFPDRQGPLQSAPFPPQLTEARQVLHDWESTGAGAIDFLIYEARSTHFMAPLPKADEHEAEFYAFGADGTGSTVAFWLVHDAPLAEQPVVFIGSEGDDNRPVAQNLPELLALLAAGIGPREAALPEDEALPVPGMNDVLNKYYPGYLLRSPKQIVDDAMAQYGDFAERMEELYYEQRMAELLADEG
jgi:hypothetical protein